VEAVRLSDLHAKFTQILPFGDGIYTGVVYVCPNDPRRKRGHGVLFDRPINPYGVEYEPLIMAALNANAGWRAQPKWHRAGDTIDTLTLTPSVAWPCCHQVITNGEVSP
jgi:hypothetical protein